MLSKRDVQFVRTAVRWRLLTAEQGEDVLFLCRKFEGKLSVEEIVRRRAYLDDASIEELAEAAEKAAGRERSSSRVVPAGKRPPAKKGRTVADVTHFDPDGFRPGAEVEVVRTAEPPSLGRFESDVARPSPTKLAPPKRRPQPFSSRPEPADILGGETIQSSHPGFGDDDDDEKTVVTLMPHLLRGALANEPDEGPNTDRVNPIDIERLMRIGPSVKVTAAPLTPAPLGHAAPPVRSEMAQQPTMIYPELVESMEGRDERTSAIPIIRGKPGGMARDPVLEGQLGPYMILRPIARGSQGVLYRARGPDGIGVALKVLERDVSREPDFIAEFRASAARAAEIESPHVVRILDVGLVGVRPYLAMEYVEAWSLEERLASEERPTLVESLSIARDIARAIAAAQAKGVVHGDVSPTNILVGRESRGYLTHFVLARATAGFSAPEIAVGHPEPTLASDLYGLGATLFAMLTGQRPEEAGGASALPRLVPEASAEVVDIVRRLLLPDPGARPRRADEVAGWLDAAAARARAAFDARMAKIFSPEAQRQLLYRSIALASGALVFALGGAVGGRLIGGLSGASMHGALLGAIGLVVALLLFAALGLVRRGELPLPASSAWLVRLQDGVGSVGAAILVVGLVLAPLALLNVIVALAATALLVSWVYGILLRRTIARLRPDRGVGRMLAVLGHPSVGAWRMIHAPMLATSALLASLRFAVLAYFASG